MTRKIIGVTVGTTLNPQKFVDENKITEAIETYMTENPVQIPSEYVTETELEEVLKDIPTGGGSVVNNNIINQYYNETETVGKYDLKDGTNYTFDVYIDASGNEIERTGLEFALTDYIEVEANVEYTFFGICYALYDKDKNFITSFVDITNYGTVKTFTPTEDGYVRLSVRGITEGTEYVFARFCKTKDIKKTPLDYGVKVSPFSDFRKPCNVQFFGDSNTYGYGLSDVSKSYANRIGSLIASMSNELTIAPYMVSSFARFYQNSIKLANSGKIYFNCYTDKITLYGEYVTDIKVIIDGVEQTTMTSSSAEYSVDLGYHEVELIGASGNNNIFTHAKVNAHRTFVNSAVTGTNSSSLNTYSVTGNVIIVMYGTNDRANDVGPTVTINNFVLFIRKLEAMGCDYFVLSPIPPNTGGETHSNYVRTINDVINMIPLNNYIDIYSEMQLVKMLSTTEIYSDGLHLNEHGHSVLASLVASKLHLAFNTSSLSN